MSTNAIEKILDKAAQGTFNWCNLDDCVICPRQRKEIAEARKELEELEREVDGFSDELRIAGELADMAGED